MLRTLHAFAAFALTAAACTSPATEVLIELDTDAPSDRALVITATVRGAAATTGAGGTHTWTRGGPTSDTVLPASFAVTPDGDESGTVTVTLDAQLAQGSSSEPALAFERIVRFTFVPHESAVVPVFLAIACGQATTGCATVPLAQCTVSVSCEERSMTCDRGTCVDPMVSLTPVDGGVDVTTVDAVDSIDASDSPTADVAMETRADVTDSGVDVPGDAQADTPADTCSASAPDLPDIDDVDGNCDGIDGELMHAVFVSTTGDDANDGQRARPVASLTRALSIVTGTPSLTQILVETGSYAIVGGAPITLTLPTGVALAGGYCVGFGSRDPVACATTLLPSSSVGLNVDATNNVLVEGITLQVADAPPQASAVGVHANAAHDLTLSRVIVSVGNGGNGADGVAGPIGANGGNGVAPAGNPGGPGGTNTCTGGTGGRGGAGQTMLPAAPARAGLTGVAGSTGAAGGTGGVAPDGMGGVGTAGASGADGAGGVSFGSISTTSGDYATADGQPGAQGGSGGGGGGGGGGNSSGLVSGNGGAGGGAGGCGGGPSNGGQGGGGSFGALFVNVVNTSVISCTFTASSGGTGGAGGTSVGGGTGGFGAASASSGAGGRGGHGGASGAGGGGGGGPSIGVLTFGGGVTFTSSTVLAGTGGTAGTGVIAGAAGLSENMASM